MTPRKTMDPILEKFASNFERGEDGFMAGGEDSKRSSFENKKVENLGAFDTKRFEPSKHQKKGFGKAEEYQSKRFEHGQGDYFGDGKPAVKSKQSALTGQRAQGVSGANTMADKAYRTDAYDGNLGEYRTSENVDVKGKRERMPDPKIIRNSGDEISVEEVRELLNRN